jgi:hypothetical protein
MFPHEEPLGNVRRGLPRNDIDCPTCTISEAAGSQGQADQSGAASTNTRMDSPGNSLARPAWLRDTLQTLQDPAVTLNELPHDKINPDNTAVPSGVCLDGRRIEDVYATNNETEQVNVSAPGLVPSELECSGPKALVRAGTGIDHVEWIRRPESAVVEHPLSPPRRRRPICRRRGACDLEPESMLTNGTETGLQRVLSDVCRDKEKELFRAFNVDSAMFGPADREEQPDHLDAEGSRALGDLPCGADL